LDNRYTYIRNLADSAPIALLICFVIAERVLLLN
jgi:hypothetical protein